MSLPWTPRPMDPSRDRPILLALVVGLLLVIDPNHSSAISLMAFAAILGLTLVTLRWVSPVVVLVVLVAVGIGLRLSMLHHVGSDVLDVVVAVIRHVLQGGNPYGVG